MTLINSLSNQHIKDLVKLRKSSERKKTGLILIDGEREIELAIKAGVVIKELFYCPDFINQTKRSLKSFDDNKLVETTKPVFTKISYKENPDGYLAVAEVKELELDKFKFKKVKQVPLIVILESVEKPGNLGAIIRTAYATGVDLIILNDSQTDIYNPNVIRASEGLIFSIDIVQTSREKTITWLKENKIKSYAASTQGKKNYTQAKLTGPVALLLGSEADGLSDAWLKKADELVKIPMKNAMDSLNVSVSAAVILYEIVRQRDLL